VGRPRMITIVNMPCASERVLRFTYRDDVFQCCEFVELFDRFMAGTIPDDEYAALSEEVRRKLHAQADQEFYDSFDNDNADEI
jgi:hypothetical protein